MKKFAVVLHWDTESAIGMSPVLVAVNAEDANSALQVAVDQATSGELFKRLFGDDGGEDVDIEMVIDYDSSFAASIDGLTVIN